MILRPSTYPDRTDYELYQHFPGFQGTPSRGAHCFQTQLGAGKIEGNKKSQLDSVSITATKRLAKRNFTTGNLKREVVSYKHTPARGRARRYPRTITSPIRTPLWSTSLARRRTYYTNFQRHSPPLIKALGRMRRHLDCSRRRRLRTAVDVLWSRRFFLASRCVNDALMVMASRDPNALSAVTGPRSTARCPRRSPRTNNTRQVDVSDDSGNGSDGRPLRRCRREFC